MRIVMRHPRNYVLFPQALIDVRGLLVSDGNWGENTFHCVDEKLFIDEGDHDDCLPILFLSIKIQFKVRRVKLDDRGIRIGH